MSQRIVHLSDLHLDRTFASMGCHSDSARMRREGLRDSLSRIGRMALERQALAVTIGGDLYEHDRATATTAAFLADTFARWAPMRVLIAPGNHDPLLPDSLYLRTEWPDNVHIFTSPVLEPVELTPGLTIWGLGHREKAWMGNPLDGDAPRGGGIHLALFHGAELGSRPDGKAIHGPFRLSEIREHGFHLALCGHYHRRRIDLDSGLVYPGTPEPLAFDETGARGAVLVDIGDDGGLSVTPLDVNRWWSVAVTCDISEAESQGAIAETALHAVLQQLSPLDAPRSLIRVDLTGSVGAAVGLDSFTLEGVLRDRTGAISVRVRDRTTADCDVDEARDEISARGAFTREVLAAIEGADTEAERALLEDALRYGLMALAGAEVGLR